MLQTIEVLAKRLGGLWRQSKEFRFTVIVIGVLLAIGLISSVISTSGDETSSGTTPARSSEPQMPSAPMVSSPPQDDSREKRMSLADNLNVTLTRPAVGGPNFVTTGAKTGVWKWSIDEYDTALVMTPNDYVQPKFYNEDALCSYFYPIIVKFDLKGLRFKRLIIAFPHMNVSCDIDRMVDRDARRRSQLANFERTKMTELGVAPHDTQWEEDPPRILGDHEVIVLGMKTTMTNDNYRLISVIYWWQLDMDDGHATQLAAYDPR